MAKRKLKLDFELDFEFELLGVVTPMQNYKFVFMVGKLLELDFERIVDIKLPSKNKTSELSFGCYVAIEPDYNQKLFVICNHSGSELFLPELPKFDYFITTASVVVNAETIAAHLKKSRDIITIVPIELYNVKNTQRFYFEEKSIEEDES